MSKEIHEYKGYTLILDYSKKGMFIPTYVKELDYLFDDIAKAIRFINTLID